MGERGVGDDEPLCCSDCCEKGEKLAGGLAVLHWA